MSKSQEVFTEMLKRNSDAFDSFDWVHQNYTKNPQKWQRTFNIEGERVLEVIRRYEDILCQKSQRSGYGKFTTKLSEKFWEIIRARFPKIDHVGIIPQNT